MLAQTDRQTTRFQYTPKNFVLGGIMSGNSIGFGEEINRFCKNCVIYACLSGALAPSESTPFAATENSTLNALLKDGN